MMISFGFECLVIIAKAAFCWFVQIYPVFVPQGKD